MSKKNDREGGFLSTAIPNIGGAKQQVPVDIKQATPLACLCGHFVFDQKVRLAKVSRIAPGNRTGQDVCIQTIVYLCCECGLEFGARNEKEPVVGGER